MLGQGRDTCARLQSERSATTSLCPPQVLEYLSDWELWAHQNYYAMVSLTISSPSLTLLRESALQEAVYQADKTHSTIPFHDCRAFLKAPQQG